MPKEALVQIEGIPATTADALLTKQVLDDFITLYGDERFDDLVADQIRYDGLFSRVDVLEALDLVAFNADGSLTGTDGDTPYLDATFVTRGYHNADLETAFGLISLAATSGGDLIGSFRQNPVASRRGVSALAEARSSSPITAKIMGFGDSVMHGLYTSWWRRMIGGLAANNDGKAAIGFVQGSIDAYTLLNWHFYLTTGAPGAGGGNVQVNAGHGDQGFKLNAGSVLTTHETSYDPTVYTVAGPICDKVTFCWTAQRLAADTCALQFRVDGVLVKTTTAPEMVDGTLSVGETGSGRMYVHTPASRGPHICTVTAVSIAGATGPAAIFDGAHFHDGYLDHWNGGHAGWGVSDQLARTDPIEAYLGAVNPDIVFLGFGINDADGTASEFETNLSTLVSIIQGVVPDATIVILSMYAALDRSPDQWQPFVDAASTVAETRGAVHFDMYQAMGRVGSATTLTDVTFTAADTNVFDPQTPGRFTEHLEGRRVSRSTGTQLDPATVVLEVIDANNLTISIAPPTTTTASSAIFAETDIYDFTVDGAHLSPKGAEMFGALVTEAITGTQLDMSDLPARSSTITWDLNDGTGIDVDGAVPQDVNTAIQNISYLRVFDQAIHQVVAHGATAGTARPATLFVSWYGTVAPTNMTAADTYVDTATGILYTGVDGTVRYMRHDQAGARLLSAGFFPSLTLGAYGTGSVLQMDRANGTEGAETALTSGQVFDSIWFRGHTGTGYVTSASIDTTTTALWSATSAPTDLSFSTTPVSSTTKAKRLIVKSTGDVTNLAGDLIATVGAAPWVTVVHGSTASVVRPAGALSVKWQGLVQPSNWIAGDVWQNPTTGVLSTFGGGALPLATVAASTAFTAIGNTINTTGKYTGRQAFDTTTGKPLFASGATAASTWRDSAAAVVYTPA